MDTRIVTCGICLEEININDCWCIINMGRRFYECKDIVVCKNIVLSKFPKKIDIPKIEVPKIDIPKIEVPKLEVPKIEVPKLEVPKLEVPKLEVPKIDIPKIDNDPIEEYKSNTTFFM